jgi:NADH-quinone oxidoreductase subunit E
MKKELVTQIIGHYEQDPGMLIPMMQDLQAEYGYLPAELLREMAAELDVPLTRVYGVAMFYSSFRLAPKGAHEVTLCMGTVCHLKGAPRISESICAEYGIEPGGTTSDRLFTLQAVNCVGACALAPVMIVDGTYHDGVTPDSALDILKALPREEAEVASAGPPGSNGRIPGARAADSPAASSPTDAGGAVKGKGEES